MTDDMLREDESLTVLGRRSLVEKIRTKERRLPKTQYTAMAESTPKKPRTSEDFYLFCKFILEYEKYDASDKEESQDIVQNHEDEDEKNDSISNSTHHDDQENSVAEMSSDYFEESGDASSETEDDEEEDDNYDLITCFCGKPFAGRPMIECSKCLTWIHLKCARVQRSKIPDVFICSKCKDDGKKKE